MLDKLRYYLRKPDLCERIARAEVLAKHTYAHRMRDLLASVASAGKAMETRRVSEAMETRRVSEAMETRCVSEAVETRRVSEAVETRRVSEAVETRRVSEAMETRRVSEAMETRRVSEAVETRRVSEAVETRRVSEAASVSPPHADASYFDFARPELLALVPATARRVLEVAVALAVSASRSSGASRVK